MIVAKVGEAAPELVLNCVSGPDADPQRVRLSDYSGRWLILIFYPRDFTFVCPTELTAFSARVVDFRQRDCELIGISTDPIELHQEWLATPPAKGGLGPLQFPLAADSDGSVARKYGVWVEKEQLAMRGLFIIDPDGVLQYAVVHNLNVGRSPSEVLRVLDALQTGGLCPASWTSADGTIDPEQALQPGIILGHYRIRGKLGEGTFGTVFGAWDMRLERMVALKVLKRKVFESREAILTESRAAAKLNDPHVCTIYAVEEEDGLPVIAMEHIDGRPLSEMIAASLQCDSALTLAAQIASGLATAHSQEVVHGDLKPANIMVTKEGKAKILDFGLARSQQASSLAGGVASRRQVPAAAPNISQAVDEVEATAEFSSPASDQPAGIRGSLAYMSPEQALGVSATPAGDVFSFGLMLIEMLTGNRALTEQTPAKLFVRLQALELGSELVERIDEAYRDLLSVMLAHDPLQRPAMTEVAEKLVAIGRASD